MSPVYSKNTSYLLCVCKEQGSFSLCEQDFKQDYMYYAPEGCPRGTHTDRTAYTRLYQDDWSLAHYNPHLFPRCAAYKARYARAPLRDAKQGCPHRPQGAKRACPVQKSAPRLTISRRTRMRRGRISGPLGRIAWSWSGWTVRSASGTGGCPRAVLSAVSVELYE